MLTKHQILRQKITDNGLAEKIKPNSFIWNLIIDCMQVYKDQFEPEEIAEVEPVVSERVSISEQIKKPECSHDWEHLGSGWYKCSKEFCEEVKLDKDKAKEEEKE